MADPEAFLRERFFIHCFCKLAVVSAIVVLLYCIVVLIWYSSGVFDCCLNLDAISYRHNEKPIGGCGKGKFVEIDLYSFSDLINYLKRTLFFVSVLVESGVKIMSRYFRCVSI